MFDISCQPMGDCFVQIDLLSVLGFALTIGVQTWAIVRYMIGRMDAHRDAASSEIKGLHERINEVKDQYVKRADIDRDLMHIQHTVTDMKNDVNVQMSGMNNRLDMLISTLVPP